MAEIDVDHAIRRVLHRAEDRFEGAIRALDPVAIVVPRPLSTAEAWQQLAASLVEGFRRAGIALLTLAFGTPEQKLMLERAMRGDDHG